MDEVQRLLSRREVGVMDAILVTRELLGSEPQSLGEAKTIVLTSAIRSAERDVHASLVDELVHQLTADGTEQ